jgi:hypothetical protein
LWMLFRMIVSAPVFVAYFPNIDMDKLISN